jgi:hypothetical protein
VLKLELWCFLLTYDPYKSSFQTTSLIPNYNFPNESGWAPSHNINFYLSETKHIVTPPILLLNNGTPKIQCADSILQASFCSITWSDAFNLKLSHSIHLITVEVSKNNCAQENWTYNTTVCETIMASNTKSNLLVRVECFLACMAIQASPQRLNTNIIRLN